MPAGLFIPHILGGACLGRAMGEVLLQVGFDVHPGVYAVMGSTGMLAGFSRLTISLAVIMLEITGSLRLLLPILLVIMSSKVVADRIAPGVNHVVLGMNPDIHLLEDDISEDHRLVLEGLTVHDLCTAQVVVLREKESVGHIMHILKKSPYAGYPVVDKKNRLLTFATRLELVNAMSEERSKTGAYIDVLRLTNAVPEITDWGAPAERAFRRFVATGMQHLCVVDRCHRLVGILTRTDFARLCHHGCAGVEEVRMLIHRKHAAYAAGVAVGREAEDETPQSKEQYSGLMSPEESESDYEQHKTSNTSITVRDEEKLNSQAHASLVPQAVGHSVLDDDKDRVQGDKKGKRHSHCSKTSASTSASRPSAQSAQSAQWPSAQSAGASNDSSGVFDVLSPEESKLENHGSF